MKKILILIISIILVSIFSFGETFTGKCVAVTDGDTAKVMREGKEVKVRFWGIDTPEKKQAYGTKAKQFTSGLIFGKVVKVVIMDTDRYGRFVGKIYLGETYVNLEIVKAGFAWHYVRYAPDDKDLADAEKEARKEKKGLWKDPNPIPPWVKGGVRFD